LETISDCKIEEALDLFVEAVELSENLQILGTAKEDTVFVIRDFDKDEGIDGAYVEVSIKEIVEKVSDVDRAMQFINVIANERKGVVCEGVTRIVGYYSRINNWNKSKIGELRDRTQRHYGLTDGLPRYDKERTDRVNNLS
jgi:hypothetical protein